MITPDRPILSEGTVQMGASEEAYGVGHDATFTTQPKPTHRRAEMSEIAFDGRPPSFSVPIEQPRRHPEDCERDT